MERQRAYIVKVIEPDRVYAELPDGTGGMNFIGLNMPKWEMKVGDTFIAQWGSGPGFGIWQPVSFVGKVTGRHPGFEAYDNDGGYLGYNADSGNLEDDIERNRELLYGCFPIKIKYAHNRRRILYQYK